MKLVEGRFIRPGVAEAVIGRGARDAYAGLDVGGTVALGAGTWEIVGMFESGGSAFDSEVWADASVLNGNYDRPPNLFQSATARLNSADDLDAFKATLLGDPRTTVEARSEQEYYASQSLIVSTLITVIGSLIAIVMALGAVFGALNTMYSAVAARYGIRSPMTR